jgi:sugar O-acyltransferase (sialic acid O-acetyltransferase NeuD family)
MSKTKILLIGAGGHASSCIDLIEETGKFKIIGIIGTEFEIGNKILGYEVIGNDSEIEKFKSLAKDVVLGVGQIKSAEKRIQIVDDLLSKGFNFHSVVSPHSHISKSSQVGVGTVVMHNATINTGTNIGNYSIINTGAILEHGTSVGDYSHISTGVILNGESKIGNSTFVGSGSVIKEQVKIGNNCLVGMGQVVKNDLPDNTRHVGE